MAGPAPLGLIGGAGRPAARLPGAGGAAGIVLGPLALRWDGCKTMTKRVPPLGPIGDSARTSPPMALTSSSTMASPSPELTFRSAGRRDWYSRSKTRSRSWGGMPGPSSSTSTVGRFLSNRPVFTVTCEAAYFKAFSTTLATTWPRRSESASQNTSAAGAVSIEMASPCSAAAGAKAWVASVTTLDRSTGPQCRLNAPDSNFASSSKSRDQALQPPRFRGDDAGGVLDVVGGAVGDRFGKAADGGEGRAQVVGDRHQELPSAPPEPWPGCRPSG